MTGNGIDATGGVRCSGGMETNEIPVKLQPPVPDWVVWDGQVQVKAVVTFLIRGEEVLLIEKLTGFGAGKANGPGGKIEPGESPAEAAIRETQEEVGLTPIDPVKRGELRFTFADGLSIFCHVFVAHEWTGDLRPSEEADPFWSRIDAVPYARMWEDDRHWLPLVLEQDATIDGRFGFDGDRMIWKDVQIVDGFPSNG